MADGATAIKADSLYSELELRTEGVEAGAARAKGFLKEVDIAAERTKRNLAGATLGSGLTPQAIEDQKRQLVSLFDAYKDGKITAEEFEKRAEGINFRVKNLTNSTREAASGINELRQAQKRWIDETKNAGGTGATLADPDSAARSGLFSIDARAARRAARQGEQIANELVTGITRQFELRQAEIRESVARGLLTPAQARQQGEAAAIAYNQGLLKIIERTGDQGKLSGAKGESTLIALSSRLKDVNESGQKATQGFSRLQSGMIALATQAVGMNSALGRVVFTLATLGVGTALTLGVTAGIAVIGKAYDLLSEKARVSRERIDKVIEGLERQRQQQQTTSGAALQDQIRLAEAEEAAARARFLQISRGRAVFDQSSGRITGTVVDRGRLAEAAEELRLAKERSAIARQNSTDRSAEREERYVQSLGRAIDAGTKNNAILREGAARVAEYRRQLATIDPNDKSEETVRRINKLNEFITTLTKADERAAKAGDKAAEARTRARQAFESAIAGVTPEKEDNFDKRIAELTHQAELAGLKAEEIAGFVSEFRSAIADSLRKEAGSLETQFRADIVASTISQVDNLTESLRLFDAQLADAEKRQVPFSKPLADQAREARQQVIELTKEAERLDAILKTIDRNTADQRGFLGSMRTAQKELADVTTAIANARSVLDKDPSNVKAQNALVAAEERREKILGRIKALQDAIDVLLGKQKAKTDELESRTIKVAGAVAQIANAAYGIISAFAGANDELTRMLSGVASVAGGIEDLFRVARTKDPVTDKAPGILGALKTGAGISSLLGAIGGVIAIGSSLFGKSPEDQARIQRLKENTDAIYKLTNRIGDLGKDITGTDAQKLADAIKAFQAQPIKGIPLVINESLEKALKSVGLTISDFVELARKFGVELDKNKITLVDIAAVQEAMRRSELGQFADTFAGQIAQLEAEINVFDIKDPIAQIRAFRKALDGIGKGNEAGILGDLIDSFDLSNPAGIAAAIASLQKLFTDITSGAIKENQFGGLSGQDILDSILRLLGILRTGSNETAGTGGFNVERRITEVTGGRIAAMLSTGNIHLERIAGNTASLVSLFGGIPVSPVTAPPASAMAGGGSPGVTINATFNFNSPAAIEPENAKRFVRVFTDEAVNEMDKALGGKTKWSRRAVGDVTRN